MFNSSVSSAEVPTESILIKDYSTGVFFEITAGFNEVIANSAKLTNNKRHILFLDSDGLLSEYRFYLVDSFTSMWDTAKSASYVLFVLPVAWFLTKTTLLFGWNIDNLGSTGNLLSLVGALFLTTFLLRFLTFYGAWKQKKNQVVLENLKSQSAQIKAKYADSNDPSAKQKERQETMLLYRQYNINPVSSSLQGLAFAPLLITIFVVVRYGRIVKESSTETFSLTQSIWSKLSSNLSDNVIYLLPSGIYITLFLTDVLLSYFVIKKPKSKVIETHAMKKSQRRQKMIQWGFRLFFVFIFFTVPVGTSIYWIFSSFFEIVQKLLLEFFSKISHKKAILKKKGIKMPLWKLFFSTQKIK